MIAGGLMAERGVVNAGCQRRQMPERAIEVSGSQRVVLLVCRDVRKTFKRFAMIRMLLDDSFQRRFRLIEMAGVEVVLRCIEKGVDVYSHGGVGIVEGVLHL